MKKNIFLIMGIIFLAAIFLFLIYFSKSGRDKIAFMANESIENIDIPIYPGSENVAHLRSVDKAYRQVVFKVELPYPAKDVYQFYKNKLEETGFESNFPDSFAGIQHIGEWTLGYAKPDIRNPFHANLDAFWINKKERKILWLQLFYDWKNWSSNSAIQLENNLNQNGVMWITVLNDQINIEEIDIYDFFGKLIFNNDKKNNETELSELNGYYSFGKEKFTFNFLANDLTKNSEKIEWTKVLNKKDEVYFVNNKAELTEKDFEEISVSKQMKLTWKEEFKESGLKREDFEGEYFSLSFFIKTEFADRLKEFFKINEKKEMGIIKDNRVAFYFIILGSIKQNSFTFSRISKRDTKYFLRGMIKRKELEN